ncbi:MAG: lactate utilization protein [Planctomycetota bacterium]
MDKQRFLERIKEALSAKPEKSVKETSIDSNRARLLSASMSEKEKIALFRERAESSGSSVHVADTPAKLKAILADLLPDKACVAYACGERLGKRLGCPLSDLIPATCRRISGEGMDIETLFGIDAALTGVDAAVAETGSIILSAARSHPRLISLTAEKHIALVGADQIVPDLLDWTQSAASLDPPAVPEGFTLISGPSKTADIELKLVTGVHGPSELHLVVFH